MTDEQMLSRVADFDSRLAALEQVLGVSTLDGVMSEAHSTPVLPSLLLLDQQLSALTSATSLTNLEAASSRIRNLKLDVEQLPSSQHEEAPSDVTDGEGGSANGKLPTLTHGDMEKLQALYALLPNLQSLSPTVPAIVARLRSLRTLHTSAANAASEIEDIERRQAVMEKELLAWREGLENVETAVKEANQSNGLNGRVVQGWVEDLERRMEALR